MKKHVHFAIRSVSIFIALVMVITSLSMTVFADEYEITQASKTIGTVYVQTGTAYEDLRRDLISEYPEIEAEVDGKDTTVEVSSWKSSDYDSETAGEYTFYPVISDKYTLAEDVSLPTITVISSDESGIMTVSLSASAAAAATDTGAELTILKRTGYSSEAVSGVKFTLKGTALSGGYYEVIKTTNSNGSVTFEDLPAGSYTLAETDVTNASPSVTADGSIRVVYVDEDGTVTLDGEEANAYGNFVITNVGSASGTVSVIKKWVTDNTDELYNSDGTPILPTIYLSKEEPTFETETEPETEAETEEETDEDTIVDTDLTLTVCAGFVNFSFTYNGVDYDSSGKFTVPIASGTTLNKILGDAEVTPAYSSREEDSLTFAGWYTSSSGDTACDMSAKITSDMTIYAKAAQGIWQIVNYYNENYYETNIYNSNIVRNAWIHLDMAIQYPSYGVDAGLINDLGSEYSSYDEAYAALCAVMDEAIAGDGYGKYMFIYEATYYDDSAPCSNMKFTLSAIGWEGGNYTISQGRCHAISADNLSITYGLAYDENSSTLSGYIYPYEASCKYGKQISISSLSPSSTTSSYAIFTVDLYNYGNYIYNGWTGVATASTYDIYYYYSSESYTIKAYYADKTVSK